MRELRLTQGYTTYVDDDDPREPWQFKWYVKFNRRKDGSIRNVYARRTLPDGTGRKQFLHEFLLGHKGVDHEDHDGLNNQRYNLRRANNQQNLFGRRKQQGRSSQYKGVCWVSQAHKWQVAIKRDQKTIYLGQFVKEIEAAHAYDAAAVKHFGEFAHLNFPRNSALPEGTTIGRIDGDGNYEPGNVEWQTDQEQTYERLNRQALRKAA